MSITNARQFWASLLDQEDEWIDDIEQKLLIEG